MGYSLDIKSSVTTSLVIVGLDINDSTGLVIYMKSDFGGTAVHRVVANVVTTGGPGNSLTSDSHMAAWAIFLFSQLISSKQSMVA